MPCGSKHIAHYTETGMPTIMAMTTRTRCLAMLIGMLLTITILKRAQLTTSLSDPRSATPEVTLYVENVLAALAIFFAKTQKKKRAAPEPEGTHDNDSTASPRSVNASPNKLPRALTASPAVAPDTASASGGPRPREGPVVLSIRPYGLEAIALWRTAPEGHALWQVQVTHDAAVPITNAEKDSTDTESLLQVKPPVTRCTAEEPRMCMCQCGCLQITPRITMCARCEHWIGYDCCWEQFECHICFQTLPDRVSTPDKGCAKRRWARV